MQKSGFVFSQWLEYPDSSASMQINISDPFILTAVFEPSNMNSNDIVINEINYNSSEDFEIGDWIELTNKSEFEANLSNWIFKDDNDDHVYQFPEGL